MPLFANEVELYEYFHSCTEDEDWKEMPVAQPKFMDSDQFCHKKINFARPHLNWENIYIKCCITNEAGTDCSDQTHVQTGESKPRKLLKLDALNIELSRMFLFLFSSGRLHDDYMILREDHILSVLVQ